MNWHATAGDLTLPIACSGETHRLRWRRGAVEMVDHPERDAEAALVALGGEEPACLGRLRLWEDAVSDGGFLEEWVDPAHLSPRRLSWLGMALERLRSEGFHEFLRHLPPPRAERMGRFLSTFPQEWVDRAAGAVAEAVVDGDGVACRLAPDLISVAIAHRLRRLFAATAGAGTLSLGAAALVPLTITVSTGGDVSVAGRLTGPDRAVTVVVPLRWLHRVWAAGAGVVDDHLVLDLEPIPCGDDPAGPPAEALASVVVWRDGEPGVEHRRAAIADRAAPTPGRSWALRPARPGPIDHRRRT